MTSPMPRQFGDTVTTTLKATSADFVWTSNRRETFLLLDTEFDVNRAKEFIAAKPRRIASLAVADWRGVAEMIEYREPRAELDLSVPCILAAVGEAFLPIDGWHRIRTALANGVSSIPAVKLTKRETKLALLR